MLDTVYLSFSVVSAGRDAVRGADGAFVLLAAIFATSAFAKNTDS